tara:strand:+ start:28994 stop:30226 length:1233 start_codon:yes stop_codon:yes gene_type:complete
MISNFKQNLILSYLFLSILVINIWSYYSAYYYDTNSFKYNYVFLLLLIPTFLFSFKRFFNFLISSRYKKILLLFVVFLSLDVLINYPVNKYKVDTYIFFWVIIVFSYIFKYIERRRFTRFLYYIVFVWLIFSCIEFYIIENYPLTHLNTWEGIGVQNIFGKENEYHGFGIHGLGITSQVNTSALVLFLFLSIHYIIKKRNIVVITFNLVAILITIYLLQFSSSLTGVISFLIAIYFYVISTKTNVKIKYTYSFLFLFAFIFSSLIFILGNFFGFAARTGNEEAYYYDLFLWPIQYLTDNFIIVLSGFQNYIPANITPLENRYFNLLLSVGIIFFYYSIYILYRFHSIIYANINFLLNGALIMFIYTYLIFSYFHISYIPHTNGIILFSLFFIYCASSFQKNKNDAKNYRR